MAKNDDTKTKTKTKPLAPPPDDAPQGVPGEDDRASRIAPGPEDVKVRKGTVVL